MKKYVHIMLVVLMVAGFFFTGTTAPVSAKGLPPVTSSVAEGSWTWTSASVPGTEIAQDLLPKSPYSWLQLLTNGLKIDGAAKICHPFKGGRFGWTGEIRQLVDGNWVKLVTTNAWVPSEEGVFMSCAQAPAAGTYALFGYFTKPKEYVLPSCEAAQVPVGLGLSSMDLTTDIRFFNLMGDFHTLPNTPVSYQIINMNNPFTGDLFGSTTTDGDGNFDFFGNEWFYSLSYLDGPAFTIRITTPYCYAEWRLSFSIQ